MGWSEAPIKFDVINLINIIESILLKFEDQKYLPISFQWENKYFYTIHQVESFYNLVGMISSFKGQFYYHSILYIVTEGKYLEGRYDILEPDKKEIVQHAAK